MVTIKDLIVNKSLLNAKCGLPPPLSAVLCPEIAPVSERVECLPTSVSRARIRKVCGRI